MSWYVKVLKRLTTTGCKYAYIVLTIISSTSTSVTKSFRHLKFVQKRTHDFLLKPFSLLSKQHYLPIVLGFRLTHISKSPSAALPSKVHHEFDYFLPSLQLPPLAQDNTRYINSLLSSYLQYSPLHYPTVNIPPNKTEVRCYSLDTNLPIVSHHS